MSTKSFRGVVGGVTYTDPGLFEEAAHALGYLTHGRRIPRWKVGTAVCVTLGEQKVHGQVWAPCAVRNYVWVALDNGRYVAVNTPTGNVCERPSSGVVGRVAA